MDSNTIEKEALWMGKANLGPQFIDDLRQTHGMVKKFLTWKKCEQSRCRHQWVKKAKSLNDFIYMVTFRCCPHFVNTGYEKTWKILAYKEMQLETPCAIYQYWLITDVNNECYILLSKSPISSGNRKFGNTLFIKIYFIYQSIKH